MERLENVFQKLGLTRDNGLYVTKEDTWKMDLKFPNRIRRLMERKITPDAFFCFDNRPLIFFFDTPTNKEALYKALWNFNECPVIIIIENEKVEIFYGFNFLLEQYALQRLGSESNLNDFGYFELVTGRTWENYEKSFDFKNRVDYLLLENIKAARQLLVEKYKLANKISNSLIGKGIFIRYLIDRKVKIKFDGRLRVWTSDEFCELLNKPKKTREFFDYLEDAERGFNGDLFPLTDQEYNSISATHYTVLRDLLQGRNITNQQGSLFQLYDFSIIPIEFISNVYELFIGQDNQKKEGAYYTPLFLVDYILKETVEAKLSKTGDTLACRVLDPACGSGIFLVEALRKIIEKYIEHTGIEVKSEKFKRAIKKLAQNNIYGIDKDISAVQVGIFSIYLTLLDYLEPPGIETFQFPRLFNSNFFQGDFFDTNSHFNSILSNISFDFIVGNPPWKGNGLNEIGVEYLKTRQAKEQNEKKKYEIAVNNKEISEGFILRASDFSNHNTKISFIIRSSSLYNLGYNNEHSPFRLYWLEEFFIDKVFELAAVRHEVFEKSNQPAIAPAAVIFYRYAHGGATNNNIVEHITLKPSRFFSLFKMFTISRPDFKKIKQENLKEFDWLWKVLVYGTYLDYNFIKRLKTHFQSIKEVIANEDLFVVGTGIQYSSNPTYDSSKLIGEPFIDSFGIDSFFINPDKISQFNKRKVHRLRDERLFKAPMLLFREGIDMDTLTARSAISRKSLLFKGSITSIKTLKKGDIKVLNNIAALFNSALFSYFAINVFTTIGIERERVTNYNKFSLPYVPLESDENVARLEIHQKNLYKEEQKTLKNDHSIKSLATQVKNELDLINQKIAERLNFSPLEFALLDYALSVNRVLIVGNDLEKKTLFAPLKMNDAALMDYASIFLKRFKSKIDTAYQKFQIEIIYSNTVVGMVFKNVAPSDYSEAITWKKVDDAKAMISIINAISHQKITERLFIQKDVRGFEKDFFYIFKPNESRLWHRAMAFLDTHEFADAILRIENAITI